MRKPAKVAGGFLGGLADDGHVQASSDHAAMSRNGTPSSAIA
jgi:hypothetical protein